MKFCNFELPLDVKTRLDLPRGVGEKLIVRMALRKLGFKECATSFKKAMQFGTGLADPKQKGQQVLRCVENEVP